MPDRAPDVEHSLGSGARMKEQLCCLHHPTLAFSSMPQHETFFAVFVNDSIGACKRVNQDRGMLFAPASPVPPSGLGGELSQPLRKI